MGLKLKHERQINVMILQLFLKLNAAGACSTEMEILMDISDPANPQRVDQVVDLGFAYWHSATFNNQGTKVIFTDEWEGVAGRDVGH